MNLVIAAIGIGALYLLFGWMACAIIASQFSGEKGYGERVGLAFGLIGAVVGPLVWVLMPPKPESAWKVIGPSVASIIALVIVLLAGLGAIAFAVLEVFSDGSPLLGVVIVLAGIAAVAGAVMGLMATSARGARGAVTA